MNDVLQDQPVQTLANWQERGMTLGDVLKAFPTASGVKFELSELGKGQILPPSSAGSIHDIEMNYHDLDEDDGFYREVFAMGHPEGYKDLMSTNGKVVFLGNGLSEIPLLVADRFAKGECSAPPIVVDLFSYHDLLADLQRLEGLLKFRFPYTKEIKGVQKIVDAIDAGILKQVAYRVGSGDVPQELLDAAVVINYNGPPPNNSFMEQLQLLGKDGKYYTQYAGSTPDIPDKVRNQFVKEKVETTTEEMSAWEYVITRTA